MSGGRQPRLALEGAPPGVAARPWSLADAPALVLAHRDPLVRRYATTLLDDRSQATATLAGWGGLWQDGDGAAWALVNRSGELLGGLTFALLDPVSRRGEAGYWLAAGARGRGVATVALRAGTALVVGALGWHRVDASHAVGNERSCAVARRAGYAAEGTLRDAQFYPDTGAWSDEHLHGYVSPHPPTPRTAAPPPGPGPGRPAR